MGCISSRVQALGLTETNYQKKGEPQMRTIVDYKLRKFIEAQGKGWRVYQQDEDLVTIEPVKGKGYIKLRNSELNKPGFSATWDDINRYIVDALTEQAVDADRMALVQAVTRYISVEQCRLKLVNKELQAFIESQGGVVEQKDVDLTIVKPSTDSTFAFQLRLSDMELPVELSTQNDINEYVVMTLMNRASGLEDLFPDLIEFATAISNFIYK